MPAGGHRGTARQAGAGGSSLGGRGASAGGVLGGVSKGATSRPVLHGDRAVATLKLRVAPILELEQDVVLHGDRAVATLKRAVADAAREVLRITDSGTDPLPGTPEWSEAVRQDAAAWRRLREAVEGLKGGAE